MWQCIQKDQCFPGIYRIWIHHHILKHNSRYTVPLQYHGIMSSWSRETLSRHTKWAAWSISFKWRQQLFVGSQRINIKIKIWLYPYWRQTHVVQLNRCYFEHSDISNWYIFRDSRGSMMTSSNGNIFRVTSPFWGNPPVTGGFPSQRPVTRSFGVFFNICLNKRFRIQSRRWSYNWNRFGYRDWNVLRLK